MSEPARRPALLLGISALLALLVLVLAWQIEHDARRLDEITERSRACSEEPARVTHPDAPASEPLRASSYLETGVDLRSLWQIELERVHAQGVGRVRFGSQAVLPGGKIHVVTLWATWCTACKQLLPQLRDLQRRRGATWDGVRFIPLQVLDASAPDHAVRNHAELLPAGDTRLADRSPEDAVVEALRDPSRRLYSGTLPVTFVLDCNRRARWARIGSLGAEDLADLERWIDAFIAEVDRGDPRCKEAFCGNGRCDPGEPGLCDGDCDPPALPPAVEFAEAPISPELRPRRACPPGCTDCDARGRCLGAPALRPSHSAPPIRCGDGRCQGLEDAETCCADCGCAEQFQCRRDRKGASRCLPAMLREPQPAVCGDGRCEGGRESSLNCCSDCGCEGNLRCLPGRELCAPSLR